MSSMASEAERKTLSSKKNFCLEPFGHARIEPAFHAACLNSSAKSLLQHISLFGADADPNFYLR